MSVTGQWRLRGDSLLVSLVFVVTCNYLLTVHSVNVIALQVPIRYTEIDVMFDSALALRLERQSQLIQANRDIVSSSHV